jgi:HEAT repeat protein
MKRREAFELVRRLLASGKVEGRRAAVQALAEFTGADANALVVRSLDDEDPLVQAGAAAQLRTRGIQGALGRLIELLDSPYGAVAQAARDSLAEFNARRFLASFDMLDEEARRTTGSLVKKIDPRTVPLIKEELSVHSRTRRLRALRMAVVVGVAPWVETEVIVLLGDEDHVVRSEAAAALGACRSPTASAALHSALVDRSQIVREAAAAALEQVQKPVVDDAPALSGEGGRA